MMKKLFSILLILALLTGCTLPAAPTTTGTGPSSTASTPTSPTSPTFPSVPAPEGDGLTVHFIDVGQADCALLECDGEFMLIDGGNVADSSLVVSYLQQQGVEELEAVFCSHAHEDHVGGLPGVLAVYPTEAVYAPTRTYSSNCFDDFVYYTDQQGLTIQIPEVGDTYSLGSATIEVLGPVKSYADPNNTSLVLMVQYGSNRFLFTGDMETQAENDMLDNGADVKADVLKVGHHGSDTSTGYRFLYEVDPTYGVISVGKGNSYGHPHEVPLSRLGDAEVILYRTDELGHIIAVSDGTNITFTWEDSSATPSIPDIDIGEDDHPHSDTYIGNKNSLKLHLPSCSSLPAEKNRVYFDDYEEAIDQGYVPCSKCMG